ncbi:MAG: hypothetical protein SFW62_07450 [Alphaproteobacteria bacterium]|nr:hypothetical protein [Alphaproteobacteria bacterium]
MERLKQKLEELDETIFSLEDKIGLSNGTQRDSLKEQTRLLKESRAREAGTLAIAQKAASRLDQAIQHLEGILRH